MGQFSELLEAYTAHNSNFETSRSYFSLSHAFLPYEDIRIQMLKGFPDSHVIRLKCYKGYQMEQDLLRRITEVFRDTITLKPEVSAFDGMVKGHPDFLYEGDPADCKTVPLDEHLPGERLPRRVYWQLQGYMLYMKRDRALAVYESRESGWIRDYWVKPNPTVQIEIECKYEKLIKEFVKQTN